MNKTMIALTLAASCAGLGAAAQEPMQPSGAVEALQSNSLKNFYETAASAGTFEIESGKLAQSRGTDPEVKKFGEQMVKDHTKAADELKELAAKKNVTLPTEMLKRHQLMYDGLKDEKPGKSFDNEYRTKMIVSHKEAISLFDQAANKSEDADVKAFAAKTLPTLKHHGGMAKQLPKT